MLFDFKETYEFDYVDNRRNDFSYVNAWPTSSMDRIHDSYNDYLDSQEWD